MINPDKFFANLENTTPYIKIGAEGSAGSGKTYTLAQIAAGLYRRVKSDKPIIIYDTERAAKFLRVYFEKEGIPILVKESRTLSDLTATMDYCEAGNSNILIIDSITHVWEGFLKAYQVEKNRKFLQFQDWGFIKPTWKAEYSDRLVMGHYHILFTGREGFTYDYEEINGRKELIKTGVKMKVEGDTAYEPDLLFRMERFENILDDKKEVWREATIIKDRSSLIDGQVFKNPTYENFTPFVEFLLNDVKPEKETETRSDGPLFESGESENIEKIKIRETLEEIKGIFDSMGLVANNAADKKFKADLCNEIFLTTSQTKIESMSLDTLLNALERLQEHPKVKARTNAA